LPPLSPLNCLLIERSERDTTQDWLVPRGTVPTISQLEERIDEAVVVARASEEGVREVGEMAIDAAKQARRAAEAAEKSAEAAAAARDARPAGPVSDTAPPQKGGGPVSSPPTGRGVDEQPRSAREVVIDPLRRLNDRADAISARLQKLERVPL
jgi:hypothetical protein